MKTQIRMRSMNSVVVGLAGVLVWLALGAAAPGVGAAGSGVEPAAGDLAVTVTFAGQPRANAVVCAGTEENPRQYGQRTTNAAGVASFSNLPQGLVLVTAHAGLMGASDIRARGRFGQYHRTMTIVLPPMLGGPTCGSLLPSGLGPTVTNPNLGQVTPPAFHRDLSAGIPQAIGRRIEYCFGAIGAQCGGAQHGLPVAALCASGRCQINAGSWEHDQCCFAHPNGMACRVGPADALLGHDGRCVGEWNKALAHLAAGLNWQRSIDFNRPNSTGRVEFDLYCAPAGTRLHQNDVGYCCARQADPVPSPTGIRSGLWQCR